MKKSLYILIGVSVLFSACKKNEDNNSSSSNELKQILLAGEDSASWQTTYIDSEHREGYIVNGIKTYTDTSAPLEIDLDPSESILFHESGIVKIYDDGILEGASLTYNIINEDRIEISGPFSFYGYVLNIWNQWDIVEKTDSRIEFIYDDFYPGPPGSSDTIYFDCDQGRRIIEKIN